MQSISFLGHKITKNGLKIDEKKVEAITRMESPTDPAAVQRLQGMVTYLARFLPRLSEVMEPIRKLTHKDVEWEWKEEQENAMNEIKKLVTTAPVLAYYDPRKTLTIQCDASKSGLGAALMQDGQPIAFASRALTNTEQRYAQIEKEALAIVFALEKFHQYTFGRRIHIESDHKPLESIVKKPLHRAPKRLQNMLMRMLNYDTEIHWKKGETMYLADTLSRAYLPDTDGSDKFSQIHIVEHLCAGANRIQKIRSETSEDEALQQLRSTIQHGWPETKDTVPNLVLPYFNIRDELSIHDGLVYRGERIVIPVSLRSQMKKIIHNSHLGIESCLRRARDCLYWPGMNAEIKDFVSSCEACRTFEVQNQKETLMPHDLPSRPWEKIGTDIMTYKGENYLITVDYFSNFWEIDRLPDLMSETIISKLKGHFSRYGIPDTVISDNAGQYTSQEFQRFSKEWDFLHLTISPRHSQSNGKVESAVKSAKRLLKKCRKSHTSWQMALLEWRNTPTQGIGSSPAQRLHGRRTRTLLPISSNLLAPRGAEIIAQEKEKMKQRTDKQADKYDKHAKDLPILEEGDVGCMKPYRSGDVEWKKAIVMRRLDERSYEVETPEGLYRRNRVDLKNTPETPGFTESQNDPDKPKPLEFRNNQTLSQGTNSEVKPRNDNRSISGNEDRKGGPTATPKKMEHRDHKGTVEKTPQLHRKEKTRRSPVTHHENKMGKSSPERKTRSGRAIIKPDKFKDFVI